VKASRQTIFKCENAIAEGVMIMHTGYYAGDPEIPPTSPPEAPPEPIPPGIPPDGPTEIPEPPQEIPPGMPPEIPHYPGMGSG